MFRRLLRLANPEIAFGFVLATIFWIGVLAWQAAYAPSEMEKRQCEEAAHKSGHKSEECKTLWERTTSDPVAFFTFWLVVSTIGLGVSTVLLWRAGEKQYRHARIAAFRQSRDMRESLRVAEKSADVGLAAINLSEGTAERQLRAYITLERAIVFARGTDCQFNLRFLNSGQTPAYNVRCWYRFAIRPLDEPPFDNVGNRSGASVVGARGTISVVKSFSITPEEKESIIKRQLAIFVWGRVIYEDVFKNPRFLHFRNFATDIIRETELDFIKGVGWSLHADGYDTDESEQP
jgi:hypothetical protein